MSLSTISPGLWERIAGRAGHHCEYCQTQEIVAGMPFEIEHIIPKVAGGATNEANLCLACPRCNRYKGMQTQALDDETQTIVPLFNPRQERWVEHFAWSQNGLTIVGLTPIGRATVAALQMNNPFVVRSRQVWVETGWHPPKH